MEHRVGGERASRIDPGGAQRGEIALIDGGLRTASVTAASAVKVYTLALWEFRPLVDQNSAIAWKLLEAMAKRIRDLEAR